MLGILSQHGQITKETLGEHEGCWPEAGTWDSRKARQIKTNPHQNGKKLNSWMARIELAPLGGRGRRWEGAGTYSSED